MNSNGHRSVYRFVGVLVVTLLLAACAPGAGLSPSPTLEPTLFRETEPQATQPAPEATGTSVPPTEVPITARAPQPDFTVCDGETQGTSVEATPSPQAGLPVEVDASIPPAPPARVEVVLEDGDVVVTWQGTGTDVDQFYKVYRRGEGDECWQLMGVKPVEGDNKGGYQFHAAITDQADKYLYAVTTVDIYGNESDLSMIAEP